MSGGDHAGDGLDAEGDPDGGLDVAKEVPHGAVLGDAGREGVQVVADGGDEGAGLQPGKGAHETILEAEWSCGGLVGVRAGVRGLAGLLPCQGPGQ